MAHILDDKSQYCIPFLLEKLNVHEQKHVGDSSPPPFFVGLNGVQGAGKTALVTLLRSTLSSPPYNLTTITFSLDDIYLNHADQQQLALSHPSNPLLQHRGQPSTHDIPLGRQVFDSLRQGLPTKIPAYDKSAYSGQGDRLPESEWEVVNDVSAGQKRVKVVIFEGWCVGFRALPEEKLLKAWEDAVQLRMRGLDGYMGRLGYVKFEDVKAINDALKEYDAFTDDAEDTHFVYDWRQEQERNLLSTKGAGMTVEQVNKFVDGYYPSYELFTPTLRTGVFVPKHKPEQQRGSAGDDCSWKGKQLRLTVNRQRKVEEPCFHQQRNIPSRVDAHAKQSDTKSKRHPYLSTAVIAHPRTPQLSSIPQAKHQYRPGCQRETGSAFVINILIEADRVTLLQGDNGESNLEVINTPSASGFGQQISRCKSCRVAVWSTYGGSGPIVRFVRAGTLDQASLVSPDVHIYTTTKAPWLTFPDNVPVLEEFYVLEQKWPEESLARRQTYMPLVEEYRRQRAARKG
ncbi:hypothetical protein RJZ90_001391 [Blastomyces dermatitidis]